MRKPKNTKDESFQNLLKCFQEMKMPVERRYFMEKPSVALEPSYAILRFVVSRLESGKIAFKTKEKDEKVFCNAVFIPKQKEISLHFRLPLRDEWHDIQDFCDIDVYFPLGEIEKICSLQTENAKS